MAYTSVRVRSAHDSELLNQIWRMIMARGYVEALEAAAQFGYHALNEREAAFVDSTPGWEQYLRDADVPVQDAD